MLFQPVSLTPVGDAELNGVSCPIFTGLWAALDSLVDTALLSTATSSDGGNEAFKSGSKGEISSPLRIPLIVLLLFT